jgi:hypothetical protein
LLEWLGKVPEGSERNVAINTVTGTMQQVLGDEEYADALSSNVVARDVAKLAGQPGEITADEDQDSVSVLQAMTNPQEDRTEGLANMPPSQKAKQAAAYAFGANQAGDRKLADRYLDIAFSSADDAWQQRSEHKNAVGVVQEVSEAAAQVDPVTALNRAQRLQDPTAQAIGMLAVARVVLGQSH